MPLHVQQELQVSQISAASRAQVEVIAYYNEHNQRKTICFLVREWAAPKIGDKLLLTITEMP